MDDAKAFFLFNSIFSVIFLENQMCRLSSGKGLVTSQYKPHLLSLQYEL